MSDYLSSSFISTLMLFIYYSSVFISVYLWTIEEDARALSFDYYILNKSFKK